MASQLARQGPRGRGSQEQGHDPVRESQCAKALLAQTASVAIWDIQQGRTAGTPIPVSGSALAARWSPDGKSVAIAQRDEVRVWAVPSGKPLAPAWKIDEASPQLRFSADATELAIWGKNQLRVFRVNGPAILTRKLNKVSQVLDSNGKRVALAKKNTVEIQDLSSEKARPLKLADVPEQFRFSPDNQSGVCVFADGSLRIWDLASGKPRTPLFWHGEPIRQVIYSADGRFLASAGTSGLIRIWDPATGQPLSPGLPAGTSLADMTFHDDGSL